MVYILNVEKELWQKFKKTIQKDKTINDAIVELIKKKVEEEEAKNDICNQ